MYDQGSQVRWHSGRRPAAALETRVGTFTGVSFVADDVTETHRELAAKGVNFIKGPTVEAWGTSAVFADPDGNQFVLSSA